MNKIKHIENFQLIKTLEDSSCLIKDYSAAGFPPYLRGINVAPTTSFCDNFLPNEKTIFISETSECNLNNLRNDIEFVILKTDNIPQSSEIELEKLIELLQKTELFFDSKSIGWMLWQTENVFETIAKCRAARVLWYEYAKKRNFNKDKALLVLQMSDDCYVNYFPNWTGVSYIFPYNNQKSSFQLPTSIDTTIDPWAGNSIVEQRTLKLINKLIDLI